MFCYQSKAHYYLNLRNNRLGIPYLQSKYNWYVLVAVLSSNITILKDIRQNFDELNWLIYRISSK